MSNWKVPSFSKFPIFSKTWKKLDRCTLKMTLLKKVYMHPGWVAQLVGASSCTPACCWFNSSQGAYLGCRFDPWSGHIWEATDQCFSLTLVFFSPISSLSLTLCVSKLINILWWRGEKAYILKNTWNRSLWLFQKVKPKLLG